MSKSTKGEIKMEMKKRKKIFTLVDEWKDILGRKSVNISKGYVVAITMKFRSIYFPFVLLFSLV